MPVFICENCNETLRRNKVATHNCGANCWYMSCMDCNKRFGWDNYLTHTQCVSEAERYQGALYVAKENKGDKKQQDWLGNVQAKLDAGGSASSALKPYFDRLMAYDNIPRKKAKFVNFAKNSLNLKHDPQNIAEQLWDVIGMPVTAQQADKPDGSSEGSIAPSAGSGGNTASGATALSSTPAPLPSQPPSPGADDNEQEGKDDKAARKAEKEAKKAAKKAAKEETASEADQGQTSDKRTHKEMNGSDGDESKQAGKRTKTDPLTKPIKWKKIIAKELKSTGGNMSLKELRKAAVAEAHAHPSHVGRKSKELKEEFDAVLPTFNKFEVVDGKVRIRAGKEDE